MLTHVLWVCGLAMALCVATPAVGQENNNCTECRCGSGYFTSGCSIRCCLPKVPDCQCEWFSTACTCVSEGSYLPSIHSDNVRAFSAYLGSGSFSSATASEMASDLLEALKAHATGQPEAFYAVARRIEANGAKLPANEKQLANQWIQSKGNYNHIP